MQKNCTKIEVQKGKGSNINKNYKGKVVNYIKLQQRQPEKAYLTPEKIIVQLILDTLRNGESENFNTTILDAFQSSLWDYEISSQLLKKLVQKNSKIQSIISSLLMIADGYFQIDSKKVVTNYIKMPHVLKYQSFFIVSSSDNYFLLYQVGLHKLTSQANDAIITFDVIQKITFIDIFFYQKAQEFTESLLSYQLLIQKDFYRVEFDQIVCSSPKLPQKAKDGKEQSYLFAFENRDWPESIFKQNNEVIVQYLPLQFKPLIVSRYQYTLDQYTGRYIETNYFERWKKFCQNEQIGNQNKYKLKQVADFQSAGFIIDLFQKTPDFKIKLSPQEREVVSTPNNALIIGRSGTGKTTSQILRIFAFETFIKVRCKILGVKKLQILNDYYGKDVSIHSIFTTANSYLVKEVEKYYHKLEKQAHEAVTKHKQSKTSNLDESFVSQTQSDITQYEYDVLDFLQTEQFQIAQHLQNEDHQFHQNEMNQHQEIQSFSHSTFPAFFSTQQLLILLDKQMSKPYFSKEMLQKFREKHSKQIGFLDCNGINLDQHFPNRENRNYQSSFYSSHQNKQQVIVPEVDFPIFYQQFWPSVAPRLKNNQDSISLPSLVWTQIYSYIKGSQYSYAYPNQYLPLTLYKERVENYFNSELITQIYTYFELYEEWKKKIYYFDQMDIVNNLLVNIENGHYTHFPIHYFYIDEVQDLPQALIELFCKITEQGVMFSGDTAQCILKGVGFRFQDLQTLFKNSKKIGANDIEKFQVYQLTTNFRSHNNILQLANCIVTILELLFPKTLDHLKKEISNLKGPKPVFFKNSDYQDIFKYLDDKYYAEEQCEIEFGYNQVVIVKNDEAKQHLPKAIKQNALVLTTFQAKGLEFDDVIIYNCFTFEPLSQYQWEFLSCLDVRETYVEKSIFDANVTKHQQDEYDDYEFTKDGQVKLKKLILNQRFDSKKSNDYSSLCNELKTFYVCVTRAKKRVLIFDDQPERRCLIEKLLRRLGVCDLYPQENPQVFQNYQLNYENQVKQTKINVAKQQIQIEQNEQVNEPQAINQKQGNKNQQQFQKKQLTEEEVQMWEQQGQQMFQRKVYDQAIKCFKKSKNLRMQELSCAYQAATEGSQKLAMYETQKLQYEKQKQQDIKNKMDELQRDFQMDFNDAAEKFYNLNEQFQAANCYYSGQFYIKSLILFLNLGQLQQSAKSAKHLKFWKLVVIIYFKMLNFEKCLTILNDKSLDRFFQYELLKIGYKHQYVTEEQLISYLQLQENQNDNIFNQLEEKSRNINNFEIDETEYLNTLCPEIADQIDLQRMFKEEIKIILSSQIQIIDDLLEMVYEQVKVFWEFYYKIIQNKSIINRHNFNNLKQLFEYSEEQRVTEIIKNNEMLLFLIDVLEQLNQFQLLIKLFPGQQDYYSMYNKSQKVDNESNKQPKFIQNFLQLCFTKKEKSNQEIEKLLNNEIEKIDQSEDLISCNKLFKHFRTLSQAINNYEQANDYILGKLHTHRNDKIFIEYIFGTKRAIQEIIDNYENKKVQYVHIKKTCWNIYKYLANSKNQKGFILDILSIQEDLCMNKPSPRLEKLEQIFQVKDQQLRYSIVINFILVLEKFYLKKFLKNATFEQLLFIQKLQYLGSQLFKIQSNIDKQHILFKAVCPIYQIYLCKSPYQNIIGQSFIFVNKHSSLMYYLKNQTNLDFSDKLMLFEQEPVMNLLRTDFEGILQKVNLIKLIFAIILKQFYFTNNHLQTYYQKNQSTLQEPFLALTMRNLTKQELYTVGSDQKYKQRKSVYQIATILQTLNLSIPQNLTQQISEIYVDFPSFQAFQSSWQHKLDIISVFDWLNYITKNSYIIEKRYPQLLIYQLNIVAFIFIMTLNFINEPSKKQFEIDYELFPDFHDLQEQQGHIEWSFPRIQQEELVQIDKESQQKETQEIQQNVTLEIKQCKNSEQETFNNQIIDKNQTDLQFEQDQGQSEKQNPEQQSNFMKPSEQIEQKNDQNNELQFFPDEINIAFADSPQKLQYEGRNQKSAPNQEQQQPQQNDQPYQNWNIYLSKQMFDWVKNKKTSSRNIIVNTQIDSQSFRNLAKNLFTVLIDLCMLKLKEHSQIKIFNIIYLICYNCKSIEYKDKEKIMTSIFLQVLEESLMQSDVYENEYLYEHLDLLKEFLASFDFFVPRDELNYLNIDLNPPDQILDNKGKKDYTNQLDKFVHEPIIDQYQFLRIICLGRQKQYDSQNDNIFTQINNLKKFLNISIQGKQLSYSLRKDLILTLKSLCALEEEIENSKNAESIQKASTEIQSLSNEIDKWVQTKCNKELRPFFANICSR